MLRQKVSNRYEIVSKGVSVPQELVGPLFEWIWKDSPQELQDAYKSNPRIFKDLDKGMEHAELYRVASFSNEQFKALISGKGVRWRGALESWTWNQKTTKTFLQIQKIRAPWQYSVVFKRAMPEADRVLCIACLDPKQFAKIAKDWSASIEALDKEQEIICKRKKYSKEDIIEIYYNEGGEKQEKKDLEAFL